MNMCTVCAAGPAAERRARSARARRAVAHRKITARWGSPSSTPQKSSAGASGPLSASVTCTCATSAAVRPAAGCLPRAAPQAWFAYSARCLARAVDAAVYRRTRPVRRTQALCLARSPPYDVCSRSDDLAGARIPPRPQQPSASTARASGSRTSWQVPRPQTENAKNRSYSTF